MVSSNQDVLSSHRPLGAEAFMARKKTTPKRPSTAGSASIGEERRESATPSATAVAAEALRTGVVPLAANRADESNRGDARLKAGDIDTDAMGNATVGDEAPGGSVTTPDQDRVDDIGRALGVQEADSGALRSTSELLDERDRKRARQEEPDPTTR
jgi:uncharacterized protein DUF6335